MRICKQDDCQEAVYVNGLCRSHHNKRAYISRRLLADVQTCQCKQPATTMLRLSCGVGKQKFYLCDRCAELEREQESMR